MGIVGWVDGAHGCWRLLHRHSLELGRTKGGGNCGATGANDVFRPRDAARNSGDARYGPYVRRDVCAFSISAIFACKPMHVLAEAVGTAVGGLTAIVRSIIMSIYLR